MIFEICLAFLGTTFHSLRDGYGTSERGREVHAFRVPLAPFRCSDAVADGCCALGTPLTGFMMVR